MTRNEWAQLTEQQRFHELYETDPNFYRMSPGAQHVVWERTMVRLGVVV